MPPKVTQDALGIFWDGEEVDGFTVYGYWDGSHDDEPVLTMSGWPVGTQTRSARLFGNGWTVWCWDVKVSEWPTRSEWPRHVEHLLQKIIENGARVSWGGLEGLFVDPPGLFDPARMSGGVWVAMLDSGVSKGPPDLRSVFHVLSDEDLLEIKRHLELAGKRSLREEA